MTMADQLGKKIKILFLARWYPNRYDPMFGLFIKKHAEAAVVHADVGVVYVQAVEGLESGTYDLNYKIEEKVPTAIVYYKAVDSKLPIVSPLLKIFRFYKANFIGIRKLKTVLGDFDMLHIHILSRLGLIALYYKWFYATPFVVSEHWSRYLALTQSFKGFFRKWFTRQVVKNAYAVTTVTKNLASAMQSHRLKNPRYQVLANVVHDDFFNQKQHKKLPGKTTFVHVSCFEDRSKNISGMLNVIQQLAGERDDFVFHMVGEGIDYDQLYNFAKKLEIPADLLQFKGLVEGKELARTMAGADMTVIFSNYENFPVVINESFVLGVPVLATRVGGIAEAVNDSNGILIDAGDEKALFEQMIAVMDGNKRFDSEAIKKQSRLSYGADTIGSDLYELYRKALGVN